MTLFYKQFSPPIKSHSSMYRLHFSLENYSKSFIKNSNHCRGVIRVYLVIKSRSTSIGHDTEYSNNFIEARKSTKVIYLEMNQRINRFSMKSHCNSSVSEL